MKKHRKRERESIKRIVVLYWRFLPSIDPNRIWSCFISNQLLRINRPWSLVTSSIVDERGEVKKGKKPVTHWAGQWSGQDRYRPLVRGRKCSEKAKRRCNPYHRFLASLDGHLGFREEKRDTGRSMSQEDEGKNTISEKVLRESFTETIALNQPMSRKKYFKTWDFFLKYFPLYALYCKSPERL